MKKLCFEDAVINAVSFWSSKLIVSQLNETRSPLVFGKGTIVTKRQLKMFERQLIEELVKGHTYHSIIGIIGLNSAPCRMLLRAMAAAGIGDKCLSIQAYAFINEKNEVYVKHLSEPKQTRIY